MSALVTLSEMKVQLRLTDTDHDTELQNWIDLAHSKIVRHIKSDDETVGSLEADQLENVKLAEILAVRALFEGDATAPLTDTVRAVLVDLRDPTLA